jgi:hypothetical protein
LLPKPAFKVAVSGLLEQISEELSRGVEQKTASGVQS